MFKHSVSFPATSRDQGGQGAVAYPDQDGNSDSDSDTDFAKKARRRGSKGKRKKEDQQQQQQQQQRCLYFVGDLDEKRQVAQVLEGISVSVSSVSAAAAAVSTATVRRGRGSRVSLSFRDQYVFCLAPVNVDNPDVVRALTVIAERYLLALAISASASSELEAEELTVVLPKKYLQLNNR